MQAIQDAMNALVPPGSYMFMHGTPGSRSTANVLNAGWLECNGVAVSTTTYVNLFNVIGYTYGGSGGSFNLPDFAGRIAVAAGSGAHTDVQSLGGNEGAALASRRPKHQHTVSDGHTHADPGGSTSTAGAHTHNSPYPTTAANQARGTRTANLDSTFTAHNTGFAGTNHSHSFSGGTTGSGTTALTSVGTAGMTDTPAYLVCAVAYIKY